MIIPRCKSVRLLKSAPRNPDLWPLLPCRVLVSFELSAPLPRSSGSAKKFPKINRETDYLNGALGSEKVIYHAIIRDEMDITGRCKQARERDRHVERDAICARKRVNRFVYRLTGEH